MDHPKVIVVDCDGVLTDGTVYYTQKGERFKGFHSRDIRALRELAAHGYDVRIITASSWPGLDDFASRCGVDVIVARDKAEVLPDERFICIVDDMADIPLVDASEIAYAPADCDSGIRGLVNMLYANGGKGVIAEFVQRISSAHQWTS